MKHTNTHLSVAALLADHDHACRCGGKHFPAQEINCPPQEFTDQKGQKYVRDSRGTVRRVK